MDTRHLVAYGLIALMIIAILLLIAQTRRRKEKERRLQMGLHRNSNDASVADESEHSTLILPKADEEAPRRSQRGCRYE